MGRYILGDVEGKCWFGVQDSTFMDRFGVPYSEPSYICYYYDREDLEAMEAELKVIEESMGDQLQRYEEFFSLDHGYNEMMLIEAGLDLKHLSDYADYSFAVEVRDYIKEHGNCGIEVEV
jgi:hypothetical protein